MLIELTVLQLGQENQNENERTNKWISETISKVSITQTSFFPHPTPSFPKKKLTVIYGNFEVETTIALKYRMCISKPAETTQ